MTTVTGPVTGPPKVRDRLRMTPARWVTLMIGVPVILVLIAFTGLSYVADIGTATYPVSRAIPVDHGRLTASIDGGDLAVRPGQASGAAQLTGTVEYSLIRPRFAVNGTSITLHCGLFLGNCGLNANLSVPPGTALHLASGGGNMQISGIDSAATLDSAGGDVQLSGIGTATVASGGGNLDVSGARGPLDFDTAGGDVNGTDLLSAKLTADTGGGNVSLTFTQVPASINIDSAGGDISIVLPRGRTQYAIDYRTEGGDYNSPVPENDAAPDKITVSSGGGNISITEAS